MIFAFFNLGFGEIFAIFVVVLLLFGADKIPEFARSLGKGIRYVKDATDSVKRDISSSVDDVKKGVDIKPEEIKKNFEELSNVKRRVKRQVSDILDDVTSNVDQAAKDFEGKSAKPKTSASPKTEPTASSTENTDSKKA